MHMLDIRTDVSSKLHSSNWPTHAARACLPNNNRSSVADLFNTRAFQSIRDHEAMHDMYDTRATSKIDKFSCLGHEHLRQTSFYGQGRIKRLSGLELSGLKILTCGKCIILSPYRLIFLCWWKNDNLMFLFAFDSIITGEDYARTKFFLIIFKMNTKK